jgi:hypothetical protein
MLKFNTLITLLLAFTVSLSAQTGTVDTVLWQDFETDPTPDWQLYPLGDDTIWVNYDADGLTPDGGLEEQKQWFWGPFFSSFIDTLSGDTIATNCLRSKSWMAGFAEGNRNWFITPPIQLMNNTYTLSWQSAPLQGPRYADGYSVWISTTSNDVISEPNPFTTRVYQEAQMVSFPSGQGGTIDPSIFTFSPGYIHADTFSNWEYQGLFTDGDSTLLTGFLQPHSVSLSAFAGQKIYIAFLHDADDDNQLAIDDILVSRTSTVGTADPLESSVRFFTYPNPVDNHLNVLYRLEQASDVSMMITDVSGRVVSTPLNRSNQPAGEYNHTLMLGQLAKGAYTVTLNVNGRSFSRNVVKR